MLNQYSKLKYFPHAMLFGFCIEAATYGDDEKGINVSVIAPIYAKGITPQPSTAFRITAENQTSERFYLVWEKSSFITSDQTSHRILRSRTRRINAELAQPNTAIPAGTKIEDEFVWDGWEKWVHDNYPDDPMKASLKEGYRFWEEDVEKIKTTQPSPRVILIFETENGETKEITLYCVRWKYVDAALAENQKPLEPEND